MKSMRPLLFLCVVSASGLFASDYIWIEAENPTHNPLNAQSTAPDHAQYLSEGKWLSLTIGEGDVTKKLPAEGGLLGYDFDVKKAGSYYVWDRIGMQSIR